MINLEQAEIDRLVGRISAQLITADRQKAIDHATALSNWLLASLFAINGGGVLATLNAADKLASPARAATAFIVGVIFALLSAVANQRIGFTSAQKVVPVLTYWTAVPRARSATRRWRLNSPPWKRTISSGRLSAQS